MIFDCDYVTSLVLRWQRSTDTCAQGKIMEQILEASRCLVEVVVSSYDAIDREDLIQESMLKLQHATQYYDPRVGNLHNYYTTVIKNCCATWSRRYDRDGDCADVDEIAEYKLISNNPTEDDRDGDEDIVTELIVRNRERFPSIPATILDDLTENIYYSMRLGNSFKSRVVTQLALRFGIAKTLVDVVYKSSLIYMRQKHIKFASTDKLNEPEFSLTHDLKAVLDKKSYDRVMVIFAGLTLHIPQ